MAKLEDFYGNSILDLERLKVAKMCLRMWNCHSKDRVKSELLRLAFCERSDSVYFRDIGNFEREQACIRSAIAIKRFVDSELL